MAKRIGGNVITIAYPGVKLGGSMILGSMAMISRQRKEEIVDLFERKLHRGPGSTQEIKKIPKDELEQTLVRLSYRDEDSGLHLVVNDEIYQRKVQLQQKWLAVIIVMFIISLAVLFGEEFIPLLHLAP